MRGVIKLSNCRSSRFSVSGRMSAKTIRAPRNTKAFAVDTKVKEGTITSSPGWMSSNRAHISRAWVQEVVTIALGTPSVCSKKAWHLLE